MTSGSGEVFASPMLLNFLSNISPVNFPNLRLSLYSNGLLAKNRWHRVEHLESLIGKVTISVDATQSDTYEKLRRGGKWDDLLENIIFLQSKCKDIGAKFHTRMIIQKENYRQALEFYTWSRNFGVDVVEYSQLTNWNTWSLSEFQHHDVFNRLHPEYKDAREVIDQLRDLPGVYFQGLV
jgi:MoaA/NifB/PqqE/SkfB family radical SAM enzyme